VKNSNGGVAGGARPAGRPDRGREAQRRRSGGSSGRIALIVAVLGLVLIVLFIVPRGQNQALQPLPRPIVTSTQPINKVDPTSNKPIVPGITSVYKGYTIGHCCEVSKQEWEALGAERKETLVRSMLK
jgi:hypothetical protein